MILSRLSGFVPLSLAEVVLFLGGALLVGALARGTWSSVRAGDPRIFGALALRCLSWGFLVLVVFFLLFGFDYDRPRLSTRLGWGGVDDESLRRAAREAVDLGNCLYAEAFRSPDLGTPTPLPADLDPRLEGGYERLGTQLGFDRLFLARRGPAKPMVASILMSHLRLSGFYFPWTGEANFNRLVPACERAHTVAHEKAHQRGIAREDEANFMGALACLFSKDPAIRYAGALFAENDLLRELHRRRDPELGGILALRGAGVVRDVEAERDFWSRYVGVASNVSEAVNNTYLKSQGVAQGTRSYEESPRLLILFFARFCPTGSCGSLGQAN